MTTRKTIVLTIQIFVGKVMSLLFFFLNEGNNAYILEFEKNMEEMINTSISSYGKWDPLLNLRLTAEMLAFTDVFLKDPSLQSNNEKTLDKSKLRDLLQHT